MPETPVAEPPLRTCPACGQAARTRFERCPHCFANYFATPPAVRRRRALAGAAAILAVAGLVGVLAATLASHHDRQLARERVAVARDVRALRARITRVEAPHRGAAPQLRPPRGASPAVRLRARRALVVAVEGAITRDARARARSGELDGPILRTDCGPILKSKAAIPDDRVLAKRIGRYDCVAIKRRIVDTSGHEVADLGHAFVAALNFDRFTYTWCRNTPAQGEAGKALVFVRLQRACLAARGRALGTGYADDGR